MLTLCTLIRTASPLHHTAGCTEVLDTSRSLMAPQVICVLTFQDTNCCGHPAPTLALCSAAPYPRPHRWTILALSAESCHSSASGRRPKLKTAGRSRGLGVEGWRDWEGDQAEKGEGERDSREGDGERESVYNFGEHRKRQHWEQTFLSWLPPFGLFHISSKTSALTERRQGVIICLLH